VREVKMNESMHQNPETLFFLTWRVHDQTILYTTINENFIAIIITDHRTIVNADRGRKKSKTKKSPPTILQIRKTCWHEEKYHLYNKQQCNNMSGFKS
jgi:hypothetical protein